MICLLLSKYRCTQHTREQIRAARQALLPEILEREGLTLRHTGADNYKLIEHPEMIIKDC